MMHPATQHRTRGVTWRGMAVVALIAIAWQSVRLFTQALWVTPDSAGYVTLAVGFAERWDWSNPLLLFRLPGYPLMLAGVCELFGTQAGLGLRILQHTLVVGCACLTVSIARRLGLSQGAAIAVGVLAAANPYLDTYADAVLTEVPYTFLLLAWLVLLLRHMQGRGIAMLACASLAAGAMALFKDSGKFLLLITMLAAIGAALRCPRPGKVRAGKRCATAAMFAVMPAFLLLAPLMLQYHYAFGRWSLNCNGPMLLYQRTACVDRLDDPQSPAVDRVRTHLRAGQDAGIIEADATIHDYLPTVRAVQHAFDPVSRHTFESRALPEVAAVLGAAAWDIVRANPRAIVQGTFRHVKHILFAPDDVTAGRSGAYDVYVVRRVGERDFNRYLQLPAMPYAPAPVGRIATAIGDAFTRPLPVLGISGYEGLVCVALLGALIGVVRGPRVAAVLTALVAAYHVCGAGFLGGLEPRYVVPLHPLMLVWIALAAGGGARLFQTSSPTVAADSVAADPLATAAAGRS